MIFNAGTPRLGPTGGLPRRGSPGNPSNGVINVSTVPKLSPFRFPGGKTWLIPYIRRWLTSLAPRPRVLAEPFAGGGSVALTAVFEHLTERAVMVEIDSEVGSVWQSILGGSATALTRRIAGFRMSEAAVAALLAAKPASLEDLAFVTLVKNRTRYSGILADGAASMRLGEDGRGLNSRWYAGTIQKRILAIAARRDRIAFAQGDALWFLERARRHRDVAYFIDPPYTVAGRRLYRYSEVDHRRLFELAADLRGDVLMTYDDAPEIARLAHRHGFEVERIPMQGAKHSRKMELLIGRDLGWARRFSPAQLAADSPLKDR